MSDIENSGITPTYTDIIKRLGEQLNMRKWLILKRSIMLIWPVLVLSIVLVLGKGMYDKGTIASGSPVFIGGVVFLCVWAVLIVPYGIIMRHIFEIEKRIWVDSFFDEKNIEPKMSWKISRKLFWPAFAFRLQLFLRYYLLPIFLYLLFLIGYFILGLGFDIKMHWAIFPAILLGGPIVVWFYAYFLRIKLRFAWFIFLDQYGKPDFSYENLFAEMKKLGEFSSGEQFKKAFVANFGVDSIEALTNMVISLISSQLISLGNNSGNVAGVVLKNAGEEVTRQAGSFAKIAAMYMLYQFARGELYGKSQEINEFIYSLG